MPPLSELGLNQLIFVGVLRVAGAIAVLLVGRWLAGVARRSTRAALKRTHVSSSMAEIFERSAFYGTWLVTLFLALVVLGIPAEVLITVIGVIVIVAAVALRESLRDLAATVIFVIFQPFKVGDMIDTNGVVGRVDEILLFNTVLVTLDHRQLTIPNGNIQNTNLVNYSALDYVRLDLPVRLSFGDSLATAKATLAEIAKSDKRVLAEPPFIIDVMALNPDGVQVVLRVFTKPDDFWALRPALTERIKLEFDKQGLTIPLPQLELRTEDHTHASQPTL